MKKALCILLTLALLLMAVPAVFAAEPKITDSLQAQMDASAEGTKLETHIWLNCAVDKDEAYRLAVKECGYIGGLPLNMTLDEVYRFKEAYNRIISAQEKAVADAFLEKYPIPAEDIVYSSKHPYIVAMLTKAQIAEIAALPEVEGLYAGVENTETPVYPTELCADVAAPDDPDRAKFEAYCTDQGAEVVSFRTLYAHESGGTVDWTLVYGMTNMVAPMPYTKVIGHRFLAGSAMGSPFTANYGVYDIKNDRFIDAASAAAKKYEGFSAAFDSFGGGRLLGDLDGDDELSVIDATMLQRCDLGMRDYPADDLLSDESYASDFNRDGERDILDATCIQRYLVGLD